MKIPLLLLRNLYSSTTYLGWNSHWIEAVLAWTWIWLPEFSWVHFHGPKRRFYVCKLRWTHFFELSKWWGIHSFFYLGGKAKHSLLDSSSSSIGGVLQLLLRAQGPFQFFIFIKLSKTLDSAPAAAAHLFWLKTVNEQTL